MTGKELKQKLRAAGVASESCRWLRIAPETILGEALTRAGKPLGFWSVTLPRGKRTAELAAEVLRAEGIDPAQVQFLASHDDFSPEERAVIDAGGTVDGWGRTI
jgi:hypothetical protein